MALRVQHLERRRTSLEDAYLAEVPPPEAITINYEDAAVRHDAFFRRRPSQPLAPRQINKRVVLHDHLLFEAIQTYFPLNAREVHAPQTHESDGHAAPTRAEQLEG